MAGHKGHSFARFALAFARLGVVASAFYLLWYVGDDRWNKYQENGIIQRRSVHQTDEPWFELAICFGPQLPEYVINEYMDVINQKKPGQYKKHKIFIEKEKLGQVYKRVPHGYEKENDTHYSKMVFEGSMAVDSVKNYGSFFGKRYHWTDDVFDIAALPTIQINQYLDSIIHRLTLGGAEVYHSLRYTDMPFMFHFSMCRNFSYDFKYGGVDTKSTSRDFVHEVVMDRKTHENLLQSGIARYVDFFVYPRGHFSEFPLLADHISYRVDMTDHKLLSVVGEKTEKLTRNKKTRKTPKWVCKSDKDYPEYSYMNCITWCLMRGLLDHVKCIMPLMVPYIYNTTGRIPHLEPVEVSPPPPVNGSAANSSSPEDYIDRDIKFSFAETFTAATAWPWMKNYTKLPLCKSANAFADTFKMLTKALYPRGDTKFPLSSKCPEECNPECSEYNVVINLAGTKLILNEEDASGNDSYTYEYIHGVTLIHSTSMDVIYERWMYTLKQLLIDMSGVLSFLLGVSVIAIHDWSFTFVEWGMQKGGCLEEQPDSKGFF